MAKGRKKTGYDDFLDVLRKFRGLSVTAVAGGATVPFLAYVADIVPPWPPGAILITALVELVALVVVFQLFRPSPRKTINKVMAVTAPMLLLMSAVYLLLFAFITYPGAPGDPRGVRGFVCRQDVPKVTASECPFVTAERLKDAAYDAELIWVDWSIQANRVILMLVWLASFLLLSSLIGTFLVFQTKVKGTA